MHPDEDGLELKMAENILNKTPRVQEQRRIQWPQEEKLRQLKAGDHDVLHLPV